MVISFFPILLAIILFIAGFLGIFIPIIPGVPLAWLGLFLYAYLTSFSSVSLSLVLIFLAITLITLLLDFVAPLLGVKHSHASSYGVTGASFGMLFGFFVFGPFGILIGPFAGAFLGEILAGKGTPQATKSALGIFWGFLLNAVFKAVIILVMFGFFLFSLL